MNSNKKEAQKMNLSALTELNNTKIGIVGCGHLGQAIATSLLMHGFNKNNIYVSYHGNPATYKQLVKKGLANCILDNKRLFSEADFVFITVRPQDVIDLSKLTVPKKVKIISCVAGLSTGTLKKIFNRTIMRMMVSGPDTIVKGKGIAMLYPNDHLAEQILTGMIGLRLFKVTHESDLNAFTAGVCLPGLLLTYTDEKEIQYAITKLTQQYPWFRDVYLWSKTVLPVFSSASEKQEYLLKMATKGGVTEAIVNSLQAGAPLFTALNKGITRSQQLAEEVAESLR
jgi:pyrroline-5-carboxylate reductase